MLYMVLSDKHFSFGSLVLIEIAAKLGKKETRKKNIYFSRFLMMLANHISENPIVIENKASKFDCWIQEMRVPTDLIMMNLNSGLPLVYLPIIELTTSAQSYLKHLCLQVLQ